LRIDGVEATSENVKTGTYKLSRPFYFLIKGEVGHEAQQFLDYVLSPGGQSILQSEGLTSPQ
jgi:phosphate transport system substrate-binding protein